MSLEHFIVFEMGDEAYAIESKRIKEVSRTKELKINTVPKTPNYIRGIINLRGDVVPIIHLNERFGLPVATADLPKRLIVVTHNQALIGLLVDRIIGHHKSESQCLLPPTEEMLAETPYIKGIIKEETATYFVIDLDKLF